MDTNKPHPDNTDPAGWRNPPVPESWWPVIRAHTPGFDPAAHGSSGRQGGGATSR
ncbi:AAC(3) family N-acetyltransferase [Micromonospora sp. Llam0]|uniref:AAC(3) family N-acetyltransferase n=1 Tax=Micromonospora sp. Llam0 TaxID=2485143 RepID=UPI001F1FD68B|nr:AAC(3) family N-acetyltransferase [Micromonospora sp. Llam0]